MTGAKNGEIGHRMSEAISPNSAVMPCGTGCHPSDQVGPYPRRAPAAKA